MGVVYDEESIYSRERKRKKNVNTIISNVADMISLSPSWTITIMWYKIIL